jgi:hypothetical protein
VISAAAARSVHDLAAAAARGAVNYPRLWKALSGGPWIRRGIYLSLREPPSPEAYEALFRHFLDAGFLLPPGPCSPLILPGLLSPGEEAKLAALIRWTGPPE